MNHTADFHSTFSDWPASFSRIPFYYAQGEQFIDGIPDRYITILSPVIVYWVFSFFFHLLDVSGWKCIEKYKMHESEEMKSRNLASRSHVIWTVIGVQFVQTVFGFLWMTEERRGLDHAGTIRGIAAFLQSLQSWHGGKWERDTLQHVAYLAYWWFIPAIQFVSAMLIFDTWQYFLHRIMHTNQFLYRYVHSWHHRLYVPYAFGALYNHPIEGCIIDTIGLCLADMLTRTTTRQATVMFLLLTVKNVDHHCGYNFPFDPLQFFTANNTDFHDIHHQTFGMKSNFSQSFFLHWDVIMGTRLTRQDVEQRRQQRKAKSL
jgi:sphinganine C4-monooxygenase